MNEEACTPLEVPAIRCEDVVDAETRIITWVADRGLDWLVAQGETVAAPTWHSLQSCVEREGGPQFRGQRTHQGGINDRDEPRFHEFERSTLLDGAAVLPER